jgi:hypothetical protein
VKKQPIGSSQSEVEKRSTRSAVEPAGMRIRMIKGVGLFAGGVDYGSLLSTMR